MGMHEGIERVALLNKSVPELVDIIMVMRYGETYSKNYVLPPLQRCTKCGALRHGKSVVNLVHTEEDAAPDLGGHHIATTAKRTWCSGPWEFVKEE
jgi:hypothetical protein